jgi:hypothetical protein
MTAAAQEEWRNVAPVGRSDGMRLAASRVALADFLTIRFSDTFHRKVEEVLFEGFPDGLAATLFIAGKLQVPHNVWAVLIADALADAGVEVHVVVRAASDRLGE